MVSKVIALYNGSGRMQHLYVETDGEVFNFAGWEPTGREGAIQRLEAFGHSRRNAWEIVEKLETEAEIERTRKEWESRNL